VGVALIAIKVVTARAATMSVSIPRMKEARENFIVEMGWLDVKYFCC
jgi:hypothetical protein